jgi:hypothetical protein|tara:strand:- start:1725 stop:1877 length:153 start_codon:yes stop_codon:yes gene_type:complete
LVLVVEQILDQVYQIHHQDIQQLVVSLVITPLDPVTFTEHMFLLHQELLL